MRIKATKELKRSINAMRKRTKPARMKQMALEIIEAELTDELTEMVYSMIKQDKKSKKKKQRKVEKGTKNKVVDPFIGDTEKERTQQKRAFQTIQLRVGEEFEGRFIRIMNGVFNKQKRTVLDALPRKALYSTKQTPDDFLFDEEAEAEEMAKRLKPLTLEVVREQSRAAFLLLGQDGLLTTRIPVVRQYLETQVIKFSLQVTQKTNEDLRRLLSQSVQEGDSIAETRRKISDKFEEFNKVRSERTARTEIIRATNFATEEAFVQSGVVEGKEWLAFLDERTGQDDAALNGTVVPLGASFKGPITGVEAQQPPLHVNCRCTLVPKVIA